MHSTTIESADVELPAVQRASPRTSWYRVSQAPCAAHGASQEDMPPYCKKHKESLTNLAEPVSVRMRAAIL